MLKKIELNKWYKYTREHENFYCLPTSIVTNVYKKYTTIHIIIKNSVRYPNRNNCDYMINDILFKQFAKKVPEIKAILLGLTKEEYNEKIESSKRNSDTARRSIY